jgi:apolipoprotein N-acyltransferase
MTRRYGGLFLRNHNLQLVEDFFGAGTSALILSVANLYPNYWFLSFFALLPFLWRLTRANLFRSIDLGIILGGSYAFVVFTGELLVSPWVFLFNLFGLCLIFSLFCVAVSVVKKYAGFNPVFIAVLWLGIEYTLTHDPVLGNILTLPDTGSGFLIRFSSLFGILMVSFAVVLINSLLLILFKRLAQALCSRTTFATKKDQGFYSTFKQPTLKRHPYYFPTPRAPPFPTIIPA